MLRRNDALDPQLLSQEHVVGLRVVAGVGQQAFDVGPTRRRTQRLPQLMNVRRRPTRSEGRKDTMCAAVADDGQLGIAFIRCFLPFSRGFRASSDEVGTDVSALKPGGVDRRQRDMPCPGQPPDCGGQQRRSRCGNQQSPRCLLQRREVRRVRQADGVPQVGRVVEHGRDAAVVRLPEDLENQAGKQLRLGELLGAEPVGVGQECILADLVRRQQHHPWRLACCAHGPLCKTIQAIAQEKIREKNRAFLRSIPDPYSP